MAESSEHFYNLLHTNKLLLRDLLIREQLFSKVPENWHVIITDIKNSTNAVISGMHKNVNLVATGSIVTVLNLAFKNKISIPFFFGGDGATFIVPSEIADKARQALLLFKANTMADFNLELRVGMVAVKDIYSHGFTLRISKFSLSEQFSIPVVLGNGLHYAEKIIKAADALDDDKDAGTEPDLTGMQCRWDNIAPPQNGQEIVTLLVIATSEQQQAATFRKVIHLLDDIYGSPQERQPISVSKLKLKTTFDRLGLEMRTRIGKIKWMALLRTWVINKIGYFYLRTRKGKAYLDMLVKMSDTLVIDGRINTVISGTQAQRQTLQKSLDTLEDNGLLLYGIYVSGASVMSCYVRDMKEDHIHFVDGAEGGYTKAAGVLKAKMAARSGTS